MNHRENRPSWRHFVGAPFIFSIIIPFVVLDAFVEIYHRICFPLYRIQLVERRKYIKFDRHRLQYLNPLEKLYCIYCSYGNGLLYYAFVIAGRTEKYWCGIKHNVNRDFMEPPHHKDFFEYGDEESLNKKYEK